MAMKRISYLLAATALAGLPVLPVAADTAETAPAPIQTAQAQPTEGASPKKPVTELDAITVTPTRSPETLFDLPGTASVIDAERLERQNAQSPRDAIRYEPGVSIGNSPSRTGATNYSIRGVNGNRVRLQIDPERLRQYEPLVKSGLPGVGYVRFDERAGWPRNLEVRPVPANLWQPSGARPGGGR